MYIFIAAVAAGDDVEEHFRHWQTQQQFDCEIGLLDRQVVGSFGCCALRNPWLHCPDSSGGILGIGSISHSTNSYTDAAALFVRDLISLPLDVLLGNPWSLFVYWPTLCFIGGATAILLVSHRREFLVVIAGLFAVKLLAYDIPLSMVNNVIFGGETSLPSLIDEDKSPHITSDGWLLGLLHDRADRLAHTIVCSHLGKGALGNHSGLSGDKGVGSGDCAPPRGPKETDDVSKTSPRAAFTLLILLQIVIVLAAIRILRAPDAPRAETIVGLLGLIYVLSVPSDYGKLLKSTTFEWGRVKLTTPLGGNDGVDTGEKSDDTGKKPLMSKVCCSHMTVLGHGCFMQTPPRLRVPIPGEPPRSFACCR